MEFLSIIIGNVVVSGFAKCKMSIKDRKMGREIVLRKLTLDEKSKA